MSPRPSKLRALSLSAVPIVLALVAMYVLEATRVTEEPQLVELAQRTPTRLAVFMVDSLSDRDFDEAKMPRLSRRLKSTGLHGRVRECSDAITVPCLLAAFTGVDRFSVFALRENFVGRSGSMVRSVLGQLMQKGVKVGYYGEPLLEAPMTGLSEVKAHLHNDAEVITKGMAALHDRKVQIAIMHLTKVDTTAHGHGGTSKEYQRVLRRTEKQIDAAIATLGPNDHALVMGDHGHTVSGRHAAGLEATTYAAYLGPSFSRARKQPMSITDHAAIFAHIFGYARGAHSWVDDYFQGATLADVTDLPTLSSGATVPWWSVALTWLIAFFVAFDARALFHSLRERASARVLVVLTAVVMNVVLGATWLTLRTAIWQTKTRLVASSIGFKIATALVGMALLSWLSPLSLHGKTRVERMYTLLLAGAVIFTLPTVYWFGGLLVPEIWLLLGLIALALVALWKKRLRVALTSSIAALALFSIYRVTLANYVLRNFPIYSRYLSKLGTPALALLILIVLSATLVLVLPKGKLRNQSLVALFLGAALAALFKHVPDRVFIVPCALALPLTLWALRDERIVPWAVLSIVPAGFFFSQGNVVVLAPIAMVWLLWALLPKSLAEPNPLLRAVVALTLTWMAFWTAMGCRITGLDFDFYFRWLPKGADATSQWLPQTLMTTAKYILPAAFGILLGQLSRALDARAFDLMRAVARGRLGLVLVFFAAFCFANPHAGTFILGDVSQESAFWVLILITLWLVELSARFKAPHAEPTQVA